jgi:SAM-dependent methyltransferase
MLDLVHESYVVQRRVRVLATRIAQLLPQGSSVLDVGCGDGQVDRAIVGQRPDLRVEGVDVLLRPSASAAVRPFDGTTVPYPDASFDSVLLVDVLHHTTDPMILLREASRVARRCIVIKDVQNDGLGGDQTLRFMDWVGNARHGVALPYNFWPRQRWEDAFRALGLHRAVTQTSLGLYPPPARWIFERDLHFLVRLEKSAQ